MKVVCAARSCPVVRVGSSRADATVLLTAGYIRCKLRRQGAANMLCGKSYFFSSSLHLAAVWKVKPAGSSALPLLVLYGQEGHMEQQVWPLGGGGGAEPEHIGRDWEGGRHHSGHSRAALRAAPYLALLPVAASPGLPGECHKAHF